MTYPHGGAVEIWRDHQTSGDTGTPINNPNKDEIRDWGNDIEGRIAVIGATPYDFDAVGDYEADDTDAIKNWLASFDGTPLFAAAGVFRVTERLELPEGILITGGARTRIAPFRQYDNEKDKLRPGYKHTLAGCVFIFSGTPSDPPISTGRTDSRTDLNPMMLYNFATPYDISGFSIIKDVDVRDVGGSLTTAAADSSVAGYDCGLLTLATRAFVGVTVFIYCKQGGLVNLAKVGDGLADPDYLSVTNCDITSGLVVLGAKGVTPDGSNTGIKVINCNLFGSDHHNRDDVDPDVPCFFVDGDTGGTNSGIRGASLNGCNLRTYADIAVDLRNCNDFSIIGGTAEFPSNNNGVPGLSLSGVILGTPETSNLSIFSLASTNAMGISELIDAISGNFGIVMGGAFDFALFGKGGGGVPGAAAINRLGGNSSGDPFVQLTGDASSIATDWAMSMDKSDSKAFKWRSGGTEKMRLGEDGTLAAKRIEGRFRELPANVSVVSNAIAIPDGKAFIKVSNAGVAVNVGNLSGDFLEGEGFKMRSSTSGDVITFTEAGNIRTHNSVPIVMGGSQDIVQVMFDGTFYRMAPLWNLN